MRMQSSSWAGIGFLHAYRCCPGVAHWLILVVRSGLVVYPGGLLGLVVPRDWLLVGVVRFLGRWGALVSWSQYYEIPRQGPGGFPEDSSKLAGGPRMQILS